jgi:hypothetical protein
VTATVTDGSTTLTRSWKVTIGDPAQPVITAVAPLPGSRVTANTPTLSVFTSYGAATSTVSFVVNGTDISGEVPVVDGVATYTAAPVVGSTVDVTATVTNNGRTAVRAWSFRIGPDPVKPVVTRTPSGNKTYTRRRGSVKYTLAAKVTGPAGGVSGTTVYLQSRTSTKKSWKNTYKLRTNGSGVASKAFRSTKRSTTYYRWVVVADQVVQGYTGPQQKIVVR